MYRATALICIAPRGFVGSCGQLVGAKGAKVLRESLKQIWVIRINQNSKLCGLGEYSITVSHVLYRM